MDVEFHIVKRGGGGRGAGRARVFPNSRGRAGDEWAHCGPALSYCSSQEGTDAGTMRLSLPGCGIAVFVLLAEASSLCLSAIPPSLPRSLPPSPPSFPNCQLIIFFRFIPPPPHPTRSEEGSQPNAGVGSLHMEIHMQEDIDVC